VACIAPEAIGTNGRSLRSAARLRILTRRRLSSARVTPEELRAAFPVFARFAYLNAGTCGPVPEAAVAAARDTAEHAAREGRWMPYFERMLELQDALRAAYAARLRARERDVALTTATSDGIVRVLAGLDLGAGDEIVTSDEEHPGLLGPLAHAQRRMGLTVRMVPFDRLADAVGPGTSLVAASHVSWVGGATAPSALAEVARSGVPVLLDGAQGVGATAVDVEALGCTFYAGAGQKWLCGPIGTGMLWVHPKWAERVTPVGPTYMNLQEPGAGLQAVPHDDARRHDTAALSAEACAAAVAAHDVLASFGWNAVVRRAAALAAQLADALRERGREVAPRGETTLVSWVEDDPEAVRDRLAAAGIIVRDLPGWPYVRASLGAWSDESDIERLLAALD